MTNGGSEKPTIQVSSETLAKLRAIAQSEGRKLQALIDEAVADLIQKRQQPRANVMASYQSSHEKFGLLYKKLAE
jgi:predicted transcriptional regulator